MEQRLSGGDIEAFCLISCLSAPRVLWWNRPLAAADCVRNEAGVDNAYLQSGKWELEVARERVPCTLHLKPLFDPTGARIKA